VHMDSSHYNNVCGCLFSTYRDEVTEDPKVTVPPWDDQRTCQHESGKMIGFR
jgi:hypothetical protein